MNIDALTKFQNFLQADNNLKKELYNMAPINTFEDEQSISKYSNELNNSLLYIFLTLKSICLEVFNNDQLIYNKILEIEENIKNKFYNCGLDINKLRLFYKNYISNMDESFIDLVKRECVGYSFGGNSVVKFASTINELLHFMHSYLVNNDYLLKKVPLVASKNNYLNFPISLRGIYNEKALDIYSNLTTQIDVGPSEIVGVNNNKILMMIRDRGHSLSLEITLADNIARVEYFIPKICNLDMVKKLPGINNINEQSVGATGVFECDINDLGPTVATFITKVPTDADMVFVNRFK